MTIMVRTTNLAFQYELGLREWLGIDHDEVVRRIERYELLGCADKGGLVFPTIQFGGAGDTIPYLCEVLSVLATGTPDCWAWAEWLSKEKPWRFGGMSAARWLSSGRELGVVLDAARSKASRWQIQA